jgi:hypothetical protein
MFQLIVAVIAIALVIALTLASIFYGGEAFTRSSLKANVAAMVNQAQQISGAHVLYKTDNAKSTDSLDALVDNGYLAEIPNAPKIVKQTVVGSVSTSAPWVIDNASKRVYIELGDANDETCDAVANNGAGKCSADELQYQFPL